MFVSERGRKGCVYVVIVVNLCDIVVMVVIIVVYGEKGSLIDLKKGYIRVKRGYIPSKKGH